MATIAHEVTDSVTMFTTEENREHAVAALDDAVAEACEWVVKTGDESHRSFFERVERATAELDVLWTITPYGSSDILQEMLDFSPRCPSIAFLHATSRFVPPKYPIGAEVLTSCVSGIGHYLPGPARYRVWKWLSAYLSPQLIAKYDCVLAVYPPVAEYVKQKISPDATVDWYLYNFYHPNATIDHRRLQVTVSGRVKRELRDYNVVFDVLDRVSDARDHLTVCFLGRPIGEFGEQIIDRCGQYEKRGYDIQYYPNGEWISAEEFAHQMAQTDLLLSPDNIKGDSGSGRRDPTRGQTKTSGAIADAVHIGRPLVMPQDFTVAPEFEELITTYKDSTDVAALIESWVSSETTRQELQQRAENSAQQFSLEKQADRFESLCRQTIGLDRQD